jgi:PAS domain S-box-containing protein
MFKKVSLFRKYAFIFSALIGGSLLLSGLLGIKFSYEENKRALTSLQREKAEAAAARIGQYLFDLEQQIGVTALPKSSVAALDQRSTEIQLLRRTAAIKEIALLDPRGKEYLRVSRGAADLVRSGADYSSTEYFRSVKSGRPYRSRVYFREGALCMSIAMAVGPADAGITVAEVDLEFLLDGISRIKVGESGHAYAVDAEGRLIAHPDIGLVLRNTSLAALPQVQAVINKSAGSEEFAHARGVDGEEVLTAFGTIPQLGWFVFVEEPVAEAYRPLYARAIQSAVLVLVGMLLTLLACVALVRRMVSPIQDMQKGATLIGNGVLEHRILVRTGDELEELASGFNRMAEQLQESYATLERKVAERTRDLSASLDQIRIQQTKLRDSEEKLRAILDSANLGVSITDTNGKYVIFNSWWTDNLGYDAEEMKNLSNLDITHSDDKEKSKDWFLKIIEGKVDRYRFEKRFLRKDKSVFWGDLSVSAVRNESGRIVNVVGMVTDITERKRAEAAVLESEERIHLLLNSTSEAIYGIDTNGNCTFCNSACLRMLGYEHPNELLGKNMHLQIHAKHANGIPLPVEECRIFQAFQRGSGTHVDDEVLWRADGTSFPAEYWSYPQRLNGVTVGAVVTFVDITERKQAEVQRLQLEAQLRESQKMEALGTLAGGVAHDFNNALAMIIGNVELARQDVGAGHPALVSLEEVDKASRRAKDLVQQILAFGRRQKLELKATSLSLVVVETARLVRATLPARITLEVNCEPDAPATLADAIQVKQILLNLCGNAVQAIQEKGEAGVIEVNLGTYEQSGGRTDASLPTGRYVCLSVRDTGRGMDEATRAHIFEPFFTTKPVGKGTGLGLAVVHGIVQAHEGRIEVESAPGKGSAFRIYFPAIAGPVEEVAQAESGAAQVDGAGKHVLYIDDEEAIIFLMKRLLERQGFRVSGFTDPREAIAAVKANPAQFDLAVTDFNMPGMSGLAVASALREIRADLPVVLASGYITEELRAKAPAAGIRELIYKPNTVDDLCEAVARCANAQSGKDKLY